MVDEPVFLDAENFQGRKEEMSFRGIVLQHVERIVKLGSTQWMDGMYVSVQTGAGAWQRIFVPSTSESYVNAVNQLEYLMFPHLDERMKRVMLLIEEKDRLLVVHCKMLALRQACVDRWKELYNVNKVWLAGEKFRVLNVALHGLGYLEGGVYHEEAL